MFRKLLFLLLIVFTSTCAFSQISIQMENDGGVYKMPCVVNGVKMKFIFDTGASKVCMSQSMAQFLLDGKYMSYDDIKGVGQSMVADGTVVNHALIVLRDIEIAGMHLHDIEATIIEGQNAPLLLGQSAIQELGKITIDGDRLIIHSAKNKLSEAEIKKLNEQIAIYMEKYNYELALECLIKLDDAIGLNEDGLKDLCRCYSNVQYDKFYPCATRWLNTYENRASDDNKILIYNLLSSYFYFSDFGNIDYHKAILYAKKALDIIENGSQDYISRLFGLIWEYERIADSYYMLGDYYKAISYYKKTIKIQCELSNVTIEQINQGVVHDKSLGYYLFNYAFCYYKLQKESEGDEIMKLSAMCGWDDAIDFCNKYKINYNKASKNLFD